MLDQLLGFIAVVAWLWFVLVVALITLRAYQKTGVVGAFRALGSFRVLLALLIAIGLSLLSASLVFIEPQEVGVVISVISPNGYREQPLRSGLRVIVPLAERVVKYPIYWQTYTMSTEPMEGSKLGNDTIAARTSDGQSVYIDSSIIYRIDPNEVIRIHTDLQNRYVDDYIRPVMRGIIRTEVSQFTADEVNSSKRKNLETNLEEILRETLNEKGFVLDRFLLRNIAFSTPYATAIEQKQVAEQERIQREYQAEQIRKLAEGERDRQKIEMEGRAAAIEREAQAQATAIVLKAQAEAQALRLIDEALRQNQSLLLYRYIEKLAPNIRVMLVPNNVPYILPLPDITGETGIPGAEGTLTTTLTVPGEITGTINILPVLTSTPGAPAVTATPTPSP
jgi:regulator of protease activity HflC (stomatin/prohibitin superfamily)